MTASNLPGDDVVSLEELTELLAEAADTSPEELERQAAEMEFPRRTRQPSAASRLPHFAYGRRSLVTLWFFNSLGAPMSSPVFSMPP